MTGNVTPADAPATEARKDASFLVNLTPMDGGAVLTLTASGPNGTTQKSRVLPGTLDAASTRRKVQKQIVGWAREAFPAPKIERKPKADKPA